jgi:hypothetical protein
MEETVQMNPNPSPTKPETPLRSSTTRCAEEKRKLIGIRFRSPNPSLQIRAFHSLEKRAQGVSNDWKHAATGDNRREGTAESKW